MIVKIHTQLPHEDQCAVHMALVFSDIQSVTDLRTYRDALTDVVKGVVSCPETKDGLLPNSLFLVLNLIDEITSSIEKEMAVQTK